MPNATSRLSRSVAVRDFHNMLSPAHTQDPEEIHGGCLSVPQQMSFRGASGRKMAMIKAVCPNVKSMQSGPLAAHVCCVVDDSFQKSESHNFPTTRTLETSGSAPHSSSCESPTPAAPIPAFPHPLPFPASHFPHFPPHKWINLPLHRGVLILSGQSRGLEML